MLLTLQDMSSTEVCCGCIPADTHENFIEMMNFGLFKDPIFVLFTLSNFATSLGFNVPYVYLADQAKMLDLTTKEGSYLLSIIGIANTFGRIILGYLSDKDWVNRLWVYNVCLTICGLGKCSNETIIIFMLNDKFSMIFFSSNGIICFMYGFSNTSIVCSSFWIYNWCICWIDISHSS